jgi:hypothetical protein
MNTAGSNAAYEHALRIRLEDVCVNECLNGIIVKYVPKRLDFRQYYPTRVNMAMLQINAHGEVNWKIQVANRMGISNLINRLLLTKAKYI